MVHVEEATLEACDRLCQLLGILFAQEREFEADASKQSVAIRMILSDPSIGKIFVLKKEEEIIGTATLLFSVSTAMGGRVAWLEDVIVDPRFRGRGYGKMLLKEVLKNALTCKRIMLRTDEDNERAQALYEQLGFKHSSMKVMAYFVTNM